MGAAKNMGWMALLGPGGMLLKMGFDFFSVSDTINEQRETALELIKAGKVNGVKSMKITMDQEAGIDFSVPIEGVNVKLKVGKSGHCIVEATY